MAIIGHGDVASVLPDREGVIFFASGVSNSKEKKQEPYDREMRLLMSQDKTKHIVYFSSLCIYDGDTEYARHKRVMENAIKHHWSSYTIIRLGNIDWGKNPNTLLNYFRAHPEAHARLVWRHVVSLEEFLYWIKLIPVGVKNEMNIPGRMVWVPDLKKEILKQQL